MSNSIIHSTYDIIVIGAGPGGYVAAIKAAQLGFKTAIIEKENLGGVCLNWGCIPSKSLLKSASDFLKFQEKCDEFGVSKEELSKIKNNTDHILQIAVKKSRGVSSTLRDGIAHLLKQNKVDVFFGTAQFMDASSINIKISKDNSEVALKSKKFIIATGSRARNLPHVPIDGTKVWSYREAMVQQQVPKSLLVIGSGAIGIEFASVYAAMGSKVTIVEIADRILIQEDKDIAKIMHEQLSKKGIEIFTKASITIDPNELKKDPAHPMSVNIIYTEDNSTNNTTNNSTGSPKTISKQFDNILSAVGIIPNTTDIGIEKTQVKLNDRGYVIINDYLGTNDPNIYAIGDVTEPPYLAHKASHEAILCVEKIASELNPTLISAHDLHPIKKNRIPGCIYASPEIASIGYTEEKAQAMGLDYKVGVFPFKANGKALAVGEPEGLVKLLYDNASNNKGALIGAHMIGNGVTEMIYGLAIAMEGEVTVEEIIHAIAPHPTKAESIHEASLAAFGLPIHIYQKK